MGSGCNREFMRGSSGQGSIRSALPMAAEAMGSSVTTVAAPLHHQGLIGMGSIGATGNL